MQKHHSTAVIGFVVGAILILGLVYFFKLLNIKVFYGPNNSLVKSLEELKLEQETKEGSRSAGKVKELEGDITVTAPLEDAVVYSPLEIKGLAKGPWFFEGSMPVSLYDAEDKLVVSGVLTAVGDSMIEDFVPFEGKLVFPPQTGEVGKLVIMADNPSGLPENDKKVELKIRFN